MNTGASARAPPVDRDERDVVPGAKIAPWPC